MSVQSRPLLITRPEAQAKAFAEALKTARPNRWQPVISPVMTVVPTVAVVDLTGIRAVVFTSANAVRVIADQCRGAGIRAYCAGPATAEAAQKAGFDAQMLAPDASGLVRALERVDGPLLHLCGEHVTRDLPTELAQSGVTAQQLVVYRQQATPIEADILDRIENGEIVDITLFSPRSARLFADQIARAPTGLRCYCLSSAIAAALPPGFATCLIAQSLDQNGMLHLL
ncbi:uroporphyrinogen-III synthase [Halovulum sp. GXIMD14793]